MKPTTSEIGLRVRYDGAGPVYWTGGPSDFGLQDKSNVLQGGRPEPDGVIAFDFTLKVTSGTSDAPVFTGEFAHGPPGKRFLYLSWRNATGEYAQRLKLPLGSIDWDMVRQARETDGPLACLLVDRNPKATTTGANIGGTRAVTWRLSGV